MQGNSKQINRCYKMCVFSIFQEAMKESGTLLEKAMEQMEEQEDEIKKLNEVDLTL